MYLSEFRVRTCENSYDYLLAKRKRARERDEDDTEDPDWTDGHIVNDDDDDEVETEEDTDTEDDSGHQASSQSDSADSDDTPSDSRRSTRINQSACLCTLRVHKCTESGNTLLLGCVIRPSVRMRIKKNLFAGLCTYKSY